MFLGASLRVNSVGLKFFKPIKRFFFCFKIPDLVAGTGGFNNGFAHQAHKGGSAKDRDPIMLGFSKPFKGSFLSSIVGFFPLWS